MEALDIILLIVDMLIAGQKVKNVYHAAPAGAVIDDEGIDDLLAWLQDAYGALLSSMANDLSFVSVTMRNLSDNGDLGIHDFPTLTNGSATGEYLPLGVAGLVTFPTNVLGSRGRKFIPGMVETQTADGLFQTAALDALATYGDIIALPFVGEASGIVWAPGVVNQAATIFRPFSGEVLVSNIPAYQRRRKQGVGE